MPRSQSDLFNYAALRDTILVKKIEIEKFISLEDYFDCIIELFNILQECESQILRYHIGVLVKILCDSIIEAKPKKNHHFDEVIRSSIQDDASSLWLQYRRFYPKKASITDIKIIRKEQLFWLKALHKQFEKVSQDFLISLNNTLERPKKIGLKPNYNAFEHLTTAQHLAIAEEYAKNAIVQLSFLLLLIEKLVNDEQRLEILTLMNITCQTIIQQELNDENALGEVTKIHMKAVEIITQNSLDSMHEFYKTSQKLQNKYTQKNMLTLINRLCKEIIKKQPQDTKVLSKESKVVNDSVIQECSITAIKMNEYLTKVCPEVNSGDNQPKNILTKKQIYNASEACYDASLQISQLRRKLASAFVGILTTLGMLAGLVIGAGCGILLGILTGFWHTPLCMLGLAALGASAGTKIGYNLGGKIQTKLGIFVPKPDTCKVAQAIRAVEQAQVALTA